MGFFLAIKYQLAILYLQLVFVWRALRVRIHHLFQLPGIFDKVQIWTYLFLLRFPTRPSLCYRQNPTSRPIRTACLFLRLSNKVYYLCHTI